MMLVVGVGCLPFNIWNIAGLRMATRASMTSVIGVSLNLMRSFVLLMSPFAMMFFPVRMSSGKMLQSAGSKEFCFACLGWTMNASAST